MNKRVQLEKWQVQGVKTSVASNVNHGSDKKKNPQVLLKGSEQFNLSLCYLRKKPMAWYTLLRVMSAISEAFSAPSKRTLSK